jgi:phosphoglucosamine mutase
MGLRLVRADVGDRYVVEAMLRDKINLGGEQSGHVVFLDHNTTGDGMLTALQVLALMRREERPLSELAGVMKRTPQVLKSVRVRSKPPLEELPSARSADAHARARMKDRGRVNVRYSGTEPVARVMIEGDDAAEIEQLANELCDAIRKDIGEERA